MKNNLLILSCVVVLLLVGCGETSQSETIGTPASDNVSASVTTEDMFGVWVGTQGTPYLGFTEEGRYCLAKWGDELDTFPGDCGTFEISDMVLTFTSDQGYCKGETGTYDISKKSLGRILMKVSSDDCLERRSNISGKQFAPES